MSDSWECFSVEEFFNQNNWSGSPKKAESDRVLNEIPWLCLQIEEFFDRSNWQGELQKVINRPAFSLTLSVGELFQHFNWEAKPEIAAIPTEKTIAEIDLSSSDRINLSDFTDLF